MWRLCCPNVIALCGEDDERDLYCCKSLQPAFKNAQEMRDLMLNTLTRRCDYCTVDYSTVGNQYLLGGASNAGADPGCLRGRGTTCMLGCVCVCVCVCVCWGGFEQLWKIYSEERALYHILSTGRATQRALYHVLSTMGASKRALALTETCKHEHILVQIL